MTPTRESDPTHLDRLHDIVVPAAVPLWPPAPGWIALAVVLVLLGAALAALAIRRRRRNRYRSEALAELERLRTRAPGPVELAGGLLVLLKRTALSAYPRRELASLSGAAWWRFLDERDREPRFSEGRGARLEALAYADAASPATEETLRDLTGAVEAWIRGHRLEAAGLRAGSGAEAR